MSATYPSYTETNFPDAIDTMTRMSDLSSEYRVLASQYYTYKDVGNDAAAAQLLLDNPILNTMIINAQKINKFIDATLALENWYNDDIKPFFENRFGNKGEYDSGTTYLQGNVISYNGEGFICRVASSVGVSPTAHTNTTNWAIIAQQGIQGESGIGLSPRGEWNGTTQYYVDDFVVHNDAWWEALSNNLNSEPTDVNSNWYKILDAASLPLSGGTMLGGIDMNHNNLNNVSSIELDPGAGYNGSFIDFHYNGSAADYTTRIIESDSGKLSIDVPNGMFANNYQVATTEVYTTTIATSWTSESTYYYQTISVSGILVDDNPIPGIVYTGNTVTDKLLNEAAALISRITTSNGSITVYCFDGAPTVAIPLKLLCVRKS